MSICFPQEKRKMSNLVFQFRKRCFISDLNQRADALGISQSYISRLEKKIMTRLRKKIEEKI